MTNQVYIFPGAGDLAPGESVRLAGPEGKHAVTVKRTSAGEVIDLVDGAGARARCEVTALGHGELTATVIDAETEPVPGHPIILVQALTKGGRDDDAIETGTEIGISEFVPWQAERSIAKWPAAKAERSRDKWEQAAIAASKQSRRSHCPRVSGIVTSAQLAERIATWVSDGWGVYILHESADARLTSLLDSGGGGSVVVVGPEGGISPGECERFVAAGARLALLGPTVLRAGSAGPAAAAVIQASCGDWR